jgi:hypothetical protein
VTGHEDLGRDWSGIDGGSVLSLKVIILKAEIVSNPTILNRICLRKEREQNHGDSKLIM